MRISYPNPIFLALYILLVSLTVSCGHKEQTTLPQQNTVKTPALPTATQSIQERGNLLVAIMANDNASYFIHKGKAQGYEYEMLNKLAEHLNVDLEIKLAENTDSVLAMLQRGEGDIAANCLTVTHELREEFDFTDRLYHSTQCLIQKKPYNWQELLPHQINNRLVRNVLNIDEKLIYVKNNSDYHKSLLHLGEDIGDSINIVEVEGVKSSFDLMALVAKGQIIYTIANTEEASLYAAYNSNIDYQTALSMPQSRAWALRKDSHELTQAINAWLKRYKRYKAYYFIYDKYYNNPSTYKKITHKDAKNSILSPYDEFIKEEAKAIAWDWRLLAAQMYQESRFNENAESHKGAIGLMQVMPATGDMHGFKNLNHNQTNIRAGVSHLKYIEKHFSDYPPDEKVKFMLGAYNVGLGHIFDAQRLAKHLGNDDKIWDDNVAEALILKSQAEYYKLPACRNGYCNGKEPYKYVYEILKRYDDYQKLIK